MDREQLIEKLLKVLEYVKVINDDLIKEDGEVIPGINIDEYNQIINMVKTILVD